MTEKKYTKKINNDILWLGEDMKIIIIFYSLFSNFPTVNVY